MSLSRRTVILAAGGGSLALIGLGGWFTVARGPVEATAPWRAVTNPEADVRLHALRHAILAPNPHNLQPWSIRLDGDDGVTLFHDAARRLPVTDPVDRQLTIGFGAFVEIARIAAAERGVAVDVVPFPEGASPDRLDARPVARLQFRRDAATRPDPLFAAILTRRSTKRAFDPARPVPAADLTALAVDGPVRTITDATPARREVLRALTWDAWQREAETPAAHLESVRLMRLGQREIVANPDGIALGGPMMEALIATGQVTREALADSQSAAFRSGADRYRRMMETATAHAWVITPGDDRSDQLAAGAAYVRFNLEATRRGLAVHPVSQALQEYAEMAQLRRRLEDTLEVAAPARLQMLARLGYAEAVGPTPRWPLETRLMS